MADITINRITHFEIYERDSLSSKTIYVPDQTEGIEEGSLYLSEILLSGPFDFGQVNSNRFEMTVFGLNQDIKGKEIRVWQTDSNGNNSVPIFVGFIDSVEYDKRTDCRKITAYDFTYKFGNYDVASLFKEAADYYFRIISTKPNPTEKYMDIVRRTLSNLESKIRYPIGLSLESHSVLSDYMSVSGLDYLRKNIPNSMSLISFIRLIGQVEYMFPNVNRQGQLEFIGIAYNEENYHTLSGSDYEGEETFFADNIFSQEVSVKIFDENGEEIDSYTSPDTTAPPHSITNNLWLNLAIKKESYQNLAMIYSMTFGSYSFLPSTIKMIMSDRSIKLGDNIWLSDLDVAPQLTMTCVFRNTLSGSLLIEQTIENDYLADELDGTLSEAFQSSAESRQAISVLSEAVDTLSGTVDGLIDSVSTLSGTVGTISGELSTKATTARIEVPKNSSVSVMLQPQTSGTIMVGNTATESVFGMWAIYSNNAQVEVYQIKSSSNITISSSGWTLTFANSNTSSSRYVNFNFSNGGIYND